MATAADPFRENRRERVIPEDVAAESLLAQEISAISPTGNFRVAHEEIGQIT